MVRVSTRAVMAFAAAVTLGGGIFAGIQAAQTTTGPIVRYDMRAGTTSGLAAMAAGMAGGGMKAGLAMMMGRGRNGPVHDLTLELGSTLAPAGGAPKADHFMPAGAKLGLSVPLKTPEPVKVTASSPSDTPAEHRDFRRPRGRMLIFWGCGEHVPAGQPVVIDFAKMAQGQMPAGLWSTSVPLDRWVSLSSSHTYGQWPNSDDRKAVSSDSSLIGAHRVAANYAPEMAFTLTHDFMAPLQVTTTMQPSGSVLMQWPLLPDATGYYASLMGANGSGGSSSGRSAADGNGANGGDIQDLVWWSSSASREFGGGLSDWLAPATVARLVAARTVMSPQTGACTIPAEVHAAAPKFMMTTMTGYGPEERFVSPARPADPRAVWHIQWEARIRHRSTTSFMPGMPGMGDARPTGGQSNGQSNGQATPCQPKKRHGLGGLGAMNGGAIGGRGNNDGC